MESITSTALRTQTPVLIQSLIQGRSVALIHRSIIIGDVVPRKIKSTANPNLAEFDAFMDQLGAKLPSQDLTYSQRQKAYHRHLKTKYGQNLS